MNAENCGCALCVSNLLISVMLNLIFLKQYKRMYHCASCHSVKPLLLVDLVDLQRAFQSCCLFACNQLKFKKKGGWPAVSDIWLMCTPIGGLAPSCLTTPSCPYQALISHFQDYLQTFSDTLVVLGKIPIVFYRSWPFPTFVAPCSWWGHWGWILRAKIYQWDIFLHSS